MNDLLKEFIAYNTLHKLAGKRKKVLLAVSGGLDSVVLCHLFRQAAYPFAVAHVNFQLRGEEADGDEVFVKALAHAFGVDFYVTRFDTATYASESKVSVQEAARTLRYKWFEEVRTQNGFQLIATAHHLSDNVETILFNFIKGTGVRGLRGMLPRNEKIIRPLLFASREVLEAYAQSNQLQWREDSSNQSLKYTRNKIRQQLIPLIKEINPSFENTLNDRLHIYRELEQIQQKRQARLSKQLFVQRGSLVFIPIKKLLQQPDAAGLLYAYLSPYGFNAKQADEILEACHAQPGKFFTSGNARILRDRKHWVLSVGAEQPDAVYTIAGNTETIQLHDAVLKLKVLPKADSTLSSDIQKASFDVAALQFPLVVRPWRAGDYFYPFGMGMKKKKVKKFLTDAKVPVHQKEHVRVLVSGNYIVWVIGLRIDERFKVTQGTRQVLQISYNTR